MLNETIKVKVYSSYGFYEAIIDVDENHTVEDFIENNLKDVISYKVVDTLYASYR